MPKASNNKTNQPAKPAPYTFQTVEAAIVHLEHVLTSDGASQLFNGAYWRSRVREASATPGLLPTQKHRLQRLLGVIESAW